MKTRTVIYALFGAMLAVSIGLVLWAGWRTGTCGYDCGMLSVTEGPAAIAFYFLGCAGVVLSCSTLFITWLAGVPAVKRFLLKWLRKVVSS